MPNQGNKSNGESGANQKSRALCQIHKRKAQLVLQNIAGMIMERVHQEALVKEEAKPLPRAMQILIKKEMYIKPVVANNICNTGFMLL
jgi:hypothetical protein